MNGNVLIIGLGLIGGSLARAIRTSHPETNVMGYDIQTGVAETALEIDVVDEAVTDLSTGAQAADLIILAAPVGGILKIIDQLAGLPMKDHVLITDVGSTKRAIVEAAIKKLPKRRFIGGHPMAGSHKSGVTAANPLLFENAYYFLTPTMDIAPKDIDKIKDYLKGTGAKFTTILPEEHDRIVGVISHFPHVVASGLVHHLKSHPDSSAKVQHLAAGGFRDMTRIASADPIMWQDIVMHNRDVILSLFDSWQAVMDEAKQMVINGEANNIKAYFEDAKLYRDDFPKKEKGALPAYHDVFVDIPDKPGEIANITRIMGEASINIINIQIIEWREDIFGILRLSFSTEADQNRALTVLQSEQYKTYIND